MAAKEAAEAGRANYKNGDYKAAALCFTEALEDIDAEDTHKLYSNRSACRMHLHDFKGAKEDAESVHGAEAELGQGLGALGRGAGAPRRNNRGGRVLREGARAGSDGGRV